MGKSNFKQTYNDIIKNKNTSLQLKSVAATNLMSDTKFNTLTESLAALKLQHIAKGGFKSKRLLKTQSKLIKINDLLFQIKLKKLFSAKSRLDKLITDYSAVDQDVFKLSAYLTYTQFGYKRTLEFLNVSLVINLR